MNNKSNARYWKIIFLILPFAISFSGLSYAQGNLENPVAGATESGISVISGWHCSAQIISITVDGVDFGKAGSGTNRFDTEPVCGHYKTGFSRLYNWNVLEPGSHTINVYADGTLLSSRQFFTVRSAGQPFSTGLIKTTTALDFPAPGMTTQLEWREAKQEFVVTKIISQATGKIAEGVYGGTASSGYTYETIILDDGEYWALYGMPNNLGNLVVYGLVQGNGSTTNGNFISTNLRDYYFDGEVAPGSFAITPTPGGGMIGLMTTPGSTISLTASPLTDSLYNYNQQAAISTINGAWLGNLIDGSSASININTSGTLNGVSNGCNFSGSISPFSSGKNGYNVNITFGSSPCIFPYQSMSGIAINSLIGNGHQQLIIAGTNSTRSAGTVFIADR